jgi:competence protein ComEC
MPGWRSHGDGTIAHGLDPRPALQRWWALEIEHRRLFNLLPVGMGIGVCLYFAADVEPAMWAPAVVLACCLPLLWLVRGHFTGQIACLAVMTVMLGFLSGGLRSHLVDQPVLARVHVGPVEGFVESVEPRPNGARVILQITQMAGATGPVPQRVRVSTISRSLMPGDHVRANARLLPPPEPARPGGYDFARDAWFKRIGAVGSLNGEIAQVPPSRPPGFRLEAAMRMDGVRTAVTQRIASWGQGQAGAVAAALVTGQRGLITEDTNTALRAAGIYHIVSISGLHMVLAAGTIFWLVRALLAALPMLALRLPVKKIAAVCAMIGATGYCVFSGSEVAAERSLIMTLVMLGAILADRPALSMRNLAIAAIIVLLIEPEQITGPSFQMSFAAVALLIAGAEFMRERRDRTGERPWLWQQCGKAGRAALAIIGTTIIASIATIPFGTYHFQTVNPYGLIGNAMAVPIVSVVAMPAAVAGMILYPFGLDGIAWWVMGQALDWVLRLSHFVNGLGGATRVIPAFSQSAIIMIAAGFVWFAVWRSPLRLLALAPVSVGLALASAPQVPDIFIARDGAGAFVRTQDGQWTVLGKPPAFTLKQWLTAAGDSRLPTDPALRRPSSCDADGCVARLSDGKSIAFVTSRMALIEDCRRADLIVTPLRWPSDCATVLADPTRLDQTGAVTIAIRSGSWDYSFARPPGEMRRWQRQRAPMPNADPPPAGTPALPDEGDAAAPLQ